MTWWGASAEEPKIVRLLRRACALDVRRVSGRLPRSGGISERARVIEVRRRLPRAGGRRHSTPKPMIPSAPDLPRSSRPRRTRVTGPEMIRWFREEGWVAAAAPDTMQQAFVDEMALPGLVIRRIWHTPVAMTRAMDADTSSERVWLQVQSTSRIRDPHGLVCEVGERDALVWAGRGIAAVDSTQPVARIEIEVAPPWDGPTEGLRQLRTGGTALHTVWTCLAGTVNVLLNADTPLDEQNSRFLSHAVKTLADAISRPPEPGVAAAGSDIARAARRLLSKNASDATYTVERAAHEIGVSRAHLTRVLSAAGASPRDILRASRLEAARRAFAVDPRADPLVVAERSGFRSVRALRSALKLDAEGRRPAAQARSAASTISADAASSLIHSGVTSARMPAASTSAADAASSSAISHASSTPPADRAP